MSSGTQVLVVEHDASMRERMVAWLEMDGFQVMACPGPANPDYECIGFSRAGCPLARVADVVVLDTWTAADAAVKGRGGFHLLRYYGGIHRPVVAIQHREALHPRWDAAAATLPWPPDRRELVETVAVLAKRADLSHVEGPGGMVGMVSPGRGAAASVKAGR